ncbi:MAG TPA: HEAT repeat domain-containing protein [Nostocaceae cyanobacterium]|nr:HEAT repeat domain-containing protein [Nostocaceae cyanobacterium]
MVDWLVIWGITQGVGILVKPILEELVKEGAKDFAKDFFKDSLNKVVFREKDPRQVAAGKAIKEFLQLVQQQLKNGCKLPEPEIKKYIPDVKTFIHNQTVKAILGKAFESDCENLDATTLKNTWNTLQLKPLPDKFDWEHITKQYLLNVQQILDESEDLRKILDSQNLDRIAKNTQATAGIIPEFDLWGYQETIKETYGHLKLDSLDTDGCAYNELKLWRMFIAQNVKEVHQVLPQIYELPKEHLKQLRESDQLEAEINLQDLERYQQSYSDQTIYPVLDIINDKAKYKYLVILGDPGAGKSTLLQYLALNWAESPLDNIISQPIPLLVELRTYMRNKEEDNCKNFLEFFHQSSGAIHHLNQHQLHEQLKAGKVLIMFDGLDEIFDIGQREDVITDIHRFTNQYPQVQVIVTSRVIGYKVQRLRDAEFKHFLLQDLDTEQIQDFINRWHDLTFNDQAADKIRKKERLERAVKTSKAIIELAGNPLLLTMMAILNRHQELPRDRPELYNQASRVLLHQWDVERALIEDSRLDPKTIYYQDKQGMLRQIAYYMQANEKGLAGNIIKANDLERILTDYLRSLEIDKPREAARVMINQLRTRNFILCLLGAERYAFIHRTFLEYFCAWEFVWQFKETQTLSIEQLKTEVYGKHWQDESWHEVLRLIAGMIEPKFTGEIIDYLMGLDGEEEKFINLFLAAELLGEVKNHQAIASTSNMLLEILKNLTSYDISYYYHFYDKEYHLLTRIREYAIIKVVAIWKEDANTLIWLKQCAELADDYHVKSKAIQELVSNFKNDPNTLQFLKQYATLNDGNSPVSMAIELLAEHYKDDPNTLIFIKQCATSNDEYIQSAALTVLAEYFKDDPDTLSILKKSAVSDYWVVRITIVRKLGSNFKDDLDTLPFLKQCAISDHDWRVQRAAIIELVENFKNNSDTLSFIKKCTISEVNTVRDAALRALAEHFKDDPNTLFFIKQAISDESWLIRRTAVEVLAQNYKDDINTLPTLKEYVSSHHNGDVRSAALKVLAENFKEEFDILPFLKEFAINDNDGKVRYETVYLLYLYYKDDSETLNILKQVAISDNDGSVRYEAIVGLSRYLKSNPELRELIYNCAKNESFKEQSISNLNPRLVALKIISKMYPQHPQTIPLLQDRAENDPDEEVRVFAQEKLAELEN